MRCLFDEKTCSLEVFCEGFAVLFEQPLSLWVVVTPRLHPVVDVVRTHSVVVVEVPSSLGQGAVEVRLSDARRGLAEGGHDLEAVWVKVVGIAATILTGVRTIGVHEVGGELNSFFERLDQFLVFRFLVEFAQKRDRTGVITGICAFVLLEPTFFLLP